MAKNTIADLDPAAGNNTDVLGQSTQGSAAASTIDNIVQNTLALIGRAYGDIGGMGTVGGTANAITLNSLSTYQTLKDGLLIAVKAPGANTGPATLNLDTLGAKAIRRQGDSPLAANDMVAKGVYLLRYDEAYNSAGAWVLLNPAVPAASSLASATEVLTGTDTAKPVTPDALAALWKKGSAVASAATVALGEGGLFHITGTATITDIDFATPKDGRRATLIFDGALTLTHNATTLKLPGGANITTAAGDRAVIVQDSDDNIIVESYTKADGLPVAGAGWDMTGQTWQDVRASRAATTSYQNTTGKPIMVAIHVSDGSGGAFSSVLQVSNNNSTWLAIGGDTGGTGGATPDVEHNSASAIVPPGHYYRVTSSLPGRWLELR